MDEKLQNTLKAQLQNSQKQLQEQITELRDVAIKATTYLEDENDTYDNHIADDASSLVGRQTDMSLLQNLERELADTELALQRMREGSYGICEICGKPIGEKRLVARPMATTCIECQTNIEAKQRQQTAAGLEA